MSSPSPNVSSLLRVSLPLVLAGLSSNLSIFVDRTILSDHSVDMMSQVTTVMNYCWALIFATSGITWISKVFVGQFNGAKQYKEVSNITWQMIIFSIACLILYIPAYYLAPFIIPTIAQEHGLIYFQVIMLGGILWPLSSALCSFFIGTYQNKTVFSILALSNILNVLLDLYWIPSMGTYGAALATVVSMIIQVMLLSAFFLSRNNQKTYSTHKIVLDLQLMQRAFILGYPESLSHFFEMSAWAAVITIISTKGKTYMLVSNIAQNLFILFMFVYCEIGNAVKAMAANYIGKHERHYIPKLAQSAMIVHTSFMLLIATIIYLQPSLFITLFSLESEDIAIQSMVIISLQGVLVFMFLDGIAYILASLLAAYGDTFASMIITGSNMWLFLVLPTYILIHFYPTTPTSHSLIVLPFYGILITACYVWRHQRTNIQELIPTSAL